MIAIAIVLSVALVCGSGLAAWVLYLRRYPPVKRAEYEALVADVSKLNQRVGAFAAAKTIGR